VVVRLALIELGVGRDRLLVELQEVLLGPDEKNSTDTRRASRRGIAGFSR